MNSRQRRRMWRAACVARWAAYAHEAHVSAWREYLPREARRWGREADRWEATLATHPGWPLPRAFDSELARLFAGQQAQRRTGTGVTQYDEALERRLALLGAP